jgi:large subunit ribosomal protein L13
VVGRLAAAIAPVLRGRHKPFYSPHDPDCGDHIVVVNAAEVVLTGDKWSQKNYYWHTGYPGGIKARSAQDMLKRKPEEVLRKAVKGMLPKNRLQRPAMVRLRIYAGEEHPHGPQLNYWGPITETWPVFDDLHTNIRTGPGNRDFHDLRENEFWWRYEANDADAEFKEQEMLQKFQEQRDMEVGKS